MKNKNSLIAIIVAIILISWANLLDDYGDRYTTDALKQAAVTYGVARSLNAVVSVIQSTEFSVGVASFSPGEALDPLNDLVERFSWIVMMAMASIGLQKLLLIIASSIIFKILLTVTGAMLIYSLLKRDGNIQNVAMRLFVITIFLRFAVGSVVFANDMVEYFFLEENRTQATEQLDKTKDSLSDFSLAFQSNKDEESMWDSVKNKLSGIVSNEEEEEEIKQKTEDASTSIIDLIVVYIAQAIFFPVVFFWMFYKTILRVWVFDWARFISNPNRAKNIELPVVDNING